MAAKTLEFWFEFASTYSYPAAERIARVAAANAARVVYRPFLLGPIFKEQGWNDSPFNLYDAKGRHMWRDLERRCHQLGLPLTRPKQFPRNGLRAARLCLGLGAHPQVPDLICALYRSNFAQDRDIADSGVLERALVSVGLDGSEWLARAGLGEVKEALKANGVRARELGIFGAPSFVAGEELFWGEDRLDQALGDVEVPTDVVGLRIRPFAVRDEGDIAALWATCGLSTPTNDPSQDIEVKRLCQPGLLFVAESRGRIVGTCMAGWEGHRGWLNYVAVAPDERGRGFGGALVRAAEARLRALGCPKVNLQVRPGNTVISFYEGLDYSQEDRRSMGKRLKPL